MSPSTFFWLGQMMPQTLKSIMVPSHAPIPMTASCPCRANAEPNRAGSGFIRSAAPNTQVAKAPQRNHQSAFGTKCVKASAWFQG